MPPDAQRRLVPWIPMVSGRRPDDAPEPQRRRRRTPAYEENLRSLGAAIEGGDGDPGRSIGNEEGLRALGDRIDRARRGGGGRPPGGGRRRRRSGRPRWSRRRKVLTAVSAVVLLALLATAAGYGYLRYRYDQFPKIAVSAEEAAQSGQPFNMLVIGSDSRVGLTPAEQKQAGNADEVAGQRSDVVMIWHVVPSTHQITVLSIPRDTMVTMPSADQSEFGQFNRINSSFNEGANSLVEAIENNFGIPISHVVEVGFGGFEGAVNALGGVWMDFPYPSKDPYSGLDITTPGCQLLDGTQALAVARSRHFYYFEDGQWQYDGTSDFGRIQRQDAFLRALIDAAESKVNPLTINAFLGSLHQGIEIDDNFSLNDLIGLAEDFHGFSASALDTQTLPTIPETLDAYGDVLFVDQPQAQQLLVSVFGSQLQTPRTPPPDTDLVSTPPPAVSASTASVSTGARAEGTTASNTSAASQPPSDTTPDFDPTACTPH